MSRKELLSLSHTHLFGMGMIALLITSLLGLSSYQSWWRDLGVFAPFLFLIGDIAAWHWASGGSTAAWMIYLCGFGYMASIFCASLAIIVDMYSLDSVLSVVVEHDCQNEDDDEE